VVPIHSLRSGDYSFNLIRATMEERETSWYETGHFP
jgi:hypothetical protein